MKNGKVERYIHETLETKGAMLFSLIDPVDYTTHDIAIKTAKASAEGVADLVLLGGSIGAQGEMLDYVAKNIREAIDVPLVTFPANNANLTKHVDAIYFMSLLNSRNPFFITQTQMLAAPLTRMFSVEPLSVGYILVSPGGTAGWVGDANLVPREKPKIAAALALTGQYLGYRMILTDTGSNPQMQRAGPIPSEMIRAVKSVIDVPYIVAGGIRTPQQLRDVYKSGGDIAQIGTAFEDHGNTVYKKAVAFSKIAKEEGAKKLKKQ